jgi:hypothetical protein
MSKREDLIKQCRYYHGEEENPFEGKDQDKALLWFYESCWVQMASEETPNDSLIEYCDYLRVSIPEYLNNDYAPMSYKVLLLDRYCHFGAGENGFRELFSKYYIADKGA